LPDNGLLKILWDFCDVCLNSPILGVPADAGSVAKAMEAASVRPDTEFREEDQSTASWHYIDICLQDSEKDLSARCPHGNCVTAKIDEYARRLRYGYYDKWGAAGDLAFLIHFIGDVHQPLHTTTNADRGGTCQEVDTVLSPPPTLGGFVRGEV
jgi:S1/P1 Nuclease